MASTDGGLTWPSYNTTNGLASNNVYAVFAVGSAPPYTIYAATDMGVSVSTTGGTSWTNYPYTGMNTGPASNLIQGIYVVGTTIYAATNAGLSISTNGGTNWTTSTVASSNVLGVFVLGSEIFASTDMGLSVSANAGLTWQSFTTSNGLGSNLVRGVFAQ